MKLYYDKRLSDPTYYVQVGFRVNGKATTKNVEKIGKHSQLLLTHPDPLAFAKEYVNSLNNRSSEKKIELLIHLNEKLQSSEDVTSKSTSVNIGYFILSAIYHELGIGSFLDKASSSSKMTFDVNQINRFLTFDRILNPRSKLQTCLHLDSYYEKPNFDYQHVMRFMDFFNEHYDNYLVHLFETSSKVIKRDTSVCFFDCTNYYFEIEEEDQDYIDEVTGEFIKGLRKYGLSKQHQPAPLVEMGLFMDKDGIPLSMCITHGSESEQLTAVPLEEKLVKMFKGKPFIYCADAGLGSFNIRKFNDMGGRKFIVTQSIKKLSDTLKEAVFNDCDYRLLSNDLPVSLQMMKTFDKRDKTKLSLYQDQAYKVIESSKAVDVGLYEQIVCKNGKVRNQKSKATLKQRVIITYSRKVAEYQKHIREQQVERARKLLKNSKPEDIKKGPNDVRRFIKEKDSAKKEYMIDESKIEAEARYDGFYAIATNLMEDDVREILAINSNRYKIEDCFRILKSDFRSRPAFHHTREHLIAHFMICYTALLIYRLLEVQLDRQQTHCTTDQIIETLKNMNVDTLNDMVSKSLYTNSRTLEAMMQLYPLELDHVYYLNNDLNKKIRKIK